LRYTVDRVRQIGEEKMMSVFISVEQHTFLKFLFKESTIHDIVSYLARVQCLDGTNHSRRIANA